MKILSIGNSFSQDATRYLHDMAASCGISLKSVNLFIGACPLRTHYLNMLEDSKAYSFEFQGHTTGLLVSLKEALLSDEWDYITLQQVSQLSVNYDTYQPYLTELAAYIRKYCPKSKLVIHQTWAYAENSHRLNVTMGYPSRKEMLADICAAYTAAADAVQAFQLLPCGQVLDKALDLGIERIHRDSIHASLGAGRYALALTWLTCLCGVDPEAVSFSDLDEPISQQDKAHIHAAVAAICRQ